ncbi:MAG: phosphate acyltransferase PlsX [Immundisolibacterales bacterium]|nr:phosphate acyltransferase PlsX [Immundisolibacterales bacterium]
MQPVTIALDAMGGDHGPSVVVPAAVSAVERIDRLEAILVGDSETIGVELANRGRTDRVRVHHAGEQVGMDESPAQALRTKKDSSMRVALDLVACGQADACVSAGNTGALLAIARFVLKTLPGIDRPAIVSALPSRRGLTHVLDLGANVDATPEQLFQFAVMGSTLVSAIHRIREPRVGLLNVGEEEIKGHETVREAARLIARSDLNYRGFVEGDGIFSGEVDVVVCDGFAGNIALKSSEGAARMIGSMIEGEFRRTGLSRIAGVLARPVLQSVRRRIDPRNYNGAIFVGLRGTVVKSHGRADAYSFENAIREAVVEVQNNVPERIGEHLDVLLSQGPGE